MNILSLLGNKNVQIGLVVLAVVGAIWFYGNTRYDAGKKDERTDWLTKIATEPVKHDTTRDTVYVPQPAQFMKAPAVRKPEPEKTTDPCADYKDEESVTFYDSLDGRHEISYDPISQTFSENYLPPFRKVVRDIVHDRQEIPILVEHNWWLTLTPSKAGSGFGVGGLIGYKALGVGYLRLPDTDVWQVGIHLDF